MAAICAVSSLPALITSLQRAHREKGALSIFLAACCTLLTATYISAAFHADAFNSVLDLWPDTAHLTTYIPLIGVALTLCCIAGNLLMWLFVRKATTDNLWRWVLIILGSFLLLLAAMAIAITVVTGLPLGTSFFCSCCGFMGAGGVAWGLTYKEICVIGNIYVEAALCLLAALWLAWACVKRYRKAKTPANALLMVLGIAYGVVCIAGFICICIHYAMPMDEAFDLCYQELVGLTQKWHISYNNVNYLLFILPFILFTAGNIYLARLIDKKG